MKWLEAILAVLVLSTPAIIAEVLETEPVIQTEVVQVRWF